MLGQMTMVPRIIVPRLVIVVEEDVLTHPFLAIVEETENESNWINLIQIKQRERKMLILKVKVLKDGDHTNSSSMGTFFGIKKH